MQHSAITYTYLMGITEFQTFLNSFITMLLVPEIIFLPFAFSFLYKINNSSSDFLLHFLWVKHRHAAIVVSTTLENLIYFKIQFHISCCIQFIFQLFRNAHTYLIMNMTLINIMNFWNFRITSFIIRLFTPRNSGLNL